MDKSPIRRFIQQLRRAELVRDGAGLTDGQLLGLYIERKDETAFADLARRHGPMVMGVCRRILRNHHDAEDAFQATFLVLVRKANSIGSPALLANWLYGVAYKTALKANAMRARRRAREKQVAPMPEEEAMQQNAVWLDLEPLLDQELTRLPDKYRIPIVLCDLEGKTRKEAARQLAWPEGTVASRVAKGRTLLAKRLARHGWVVSAGSMAAVLAENAASAGVPPPVIASVIRAASVLAAGQTAAAGIAPNVAALAEGVMKSMRLMKLKIPLAILLGASVVGFGGRLLMYRALAFEQSTEKNGAPAPAKAKEKKEAPRDAAKEPEKAKTDKENLQGTWVKVGQEFGGNPVPKEEMRAQWLHFDSDKVTTYGIDLRDSKPEKSEHTYALDADKNPKIIDFTGGQRLEGPRTKPPDDMKAIYKIDGDTLTLAVGKKDLPTKFTTKEGDGVLVVVFKREGGAKK
jgi:RNA polymerase sigma factor (sigma-70 family)